MIIADHNAELTILWSSHSQVGLLFQIYLLCHVVIVIGLVGWMATEALVEWLQTDGHDDGPRSIIACQVDRPIDDWWNSVDMANNSLFYYK